MKKGLSFLIVFLITTLCWGLLGYLLHFVFTSVSVYVFFIVGIVGGLFLGTLFLFLREDIPLPLSSVEADEAPGSDPELIFSNIRPNAASDNVASEQG